MDSELADFIEQYDEAITENAIAFARSVIVDTALNETQLRDHFPQIVKAIVADLRTPQTRVEEVAKSEGRAVAAAEQTPSAAGRHAVHRALSGYSISNLVSEYRALRASVLRMRLDATDRGAAAAGDITRFNEAIDEAIAESVSYYADEMERWRNIFLGVLGHDLRSPLSAMVMTSELIGRTAADAPTAAAAQRLIRNGEHMRALLDKLLVYNRAQLGGGFHLEKSQVDLTHACREEVELLRASMPGTRVHFQAPDPVRGTFDAGRIREALANLVVNAQKYGARGTEIGVELRDEGAGPVLSVSNSGETIVPETLDLMFEPLRRGGVSEGESEQASMGLGLFIVKQIAKAHGGTIRAESSHGKTTFTLQLPRT